MLNLKDLNNTHEIAEQELDKVEGGYFYWLSGVLMTSRKTTRSTNTTFVDPMQAILGAPRYTLDG